MSDERLPKDFARSERASDADIAVYVAEICQEMRGMSRNPKFRVLRYLLDMARAEAEQLMRLSLSKS